MFNSYFSFERDIFVDEVITYNIVNKLSFNTIMEGIDTHPPIYYLLIKSLPHNNFYSIRFYSLIIFSIAFFILYQIVDKHYGFKTAFVVSMFILYSGTISRYATEARMYSLLFLLSVLLIQYVFNKQWYHGLFIVCLMISTHYYAIFITIPFLLTLYFTDKRSKTILYCIWTICVLIILMLPLIAHQYVDNPYKIKPPHVKVKAISFISMQIFPFSNPESINNLALQILMYSFLIFLVFLLAQSKFESHKELFLLFSLIPPLILYFNSLFFSLPYHHRYVFMFVPMIFTFYAIPLSKFKNYFFYMIAIMVFLGLTLHSYHLLPNTLFQEIALDIDCPKNILHETPFSYLPMSYYLPGCDHFLARINMWPDVTNDTLYVREGFIENGDVSYDYFIHYFDKLYGDYLLNNTDKTKLQYIRMSFET